VTDLSFQPLQGHHVSLGVHFHIIDHVLLVNVASVVPENGKHAFSSSWLSLELFLSGRSGVTTLKWLAFHSQITAIHPTLVTCDNAAHKIITLTFVASNCLHASSVALFISGVS
jgi:hypothetical protein